jgi:membrane protein required for colicin V production
LEFHYFNICDVFLLTLLLFSAIVGFIRGFVRETLGLAAWGTASWIALKDFPLLTDFFAKWIHNPLLLKLSSHLAVFSLSLISFLFLTQLLCLWIQGSIIQSINRSLGIVFGLLRGFILIITGYTATLYFVKLEEHPEVITSCKSVSLLQKVVLSMDPYLPEKVHSPLFLENIKKLKEKEVDAQKLTEELSAPQPQ